MQAIDPRSPPRRTLLSTRLWAAAWLASAGACVGGLGSGAQFPGDGSGGGGASAGQTTGGANLVPNHIPAVSACTSQAPAPRSLRRLTPDEYNASARDLLGGDAGVPQSAGLFAGDPVAYGFHDIQYNLTVTTNTIGQVQSQAEAVAAYAALHPALVTAACSTADDACGQSLISDFGKRAFRRPLTADEVKGYQGLLAGITDFPTRAQVVVAAMLQSPYFLYRSELGAAAGDHFALTPYEVASELSYFVVGSIPDADLVKAADDNQLQTGAQILAQGLRLLKDPRARANVGSFFLQWLQVADIANQVHAESDGTMLSADQKTAMREETLRFVDDLVFDSGGTYQDLLTAKQTFLNNALSTFYGAGSAPGADFVKVQWAAGERLGGVLGQGGVLAAASQATNASPTLRGRALRMRFLCQPIGSPPANVPQASSGGSFKTLREAFSDHDTNPTCAACHTLMDPLAYPLGNFDALGRRRAGDMENGEPVDTSGMVNAPMVGDAQALANGDALIAYLAASPQAQACLTRHMAMWGLGQMTFDQDGCTYDAAAQFVASQKNASLQQMFLALTQTPSFLARVQDP